MLFDIIPPASIAKKNETEHIVYFKNGSIYELRGSDQPDALRGPNPVGVVFDEFDTQKADGWQVIEPVLRANDGWAWFIGTPRGKNKLYDLYNKGQEGHPEWKSWLLKATQSGIIAPEQLAEARHSPLMTQALYQQEFECAFLEAEGSVFRGVRDICTAKPKAPEQDHLYVMGVDLAKVQDYTVIRVYDRDTNAQVFTDRLQSLDWPFQKKKIAAVASHYNKALVVLDATGLGDPIADDLIRGGVSVVPFKITEQTKKDLIEKLSIWIEQKKFTMIYSEQTLLEYDNFSYEIGVTGKIRYGARSGYHDDIVLADALAISSLQEVYMPEQYKEPTPTQIAFARAKADYERKLEQQDDEAADYNEWSEVPSE